MQDDQPNSNAVDAFVKLYEQLCAEPDMDALQRFLSLDDTAELLKAAVEQISHSSRESHLHQEILAEVNLELVELVKTCGFKRCKNGNPRAYLSGLFRNKSKMAMRSRKNLLIGSWPKHQSVEESKLRDISESRPSPEREQDLEELRTLLEKIENYIGKLPDGTQKDVALGLLAGESGIQSARRLKVSPSTVSEHRTRLRATLKRRFLQGTD
jgi:RNA polymerase sigma factor (sigma-70 family)